MSWALALLACAAGPTAATEGVSRFEGRSDDGEVSWVLDFVDAPVVGEVAPLLELADVDGAPLEGVTVAIEPWMPEHGHGVSVPPTVEELGGGAFEASWVFSMAGDWEVRFDLDGGAHGWVTDVVVR